MHMHITYPCRDTANRLRVYTAGAGCRGRLSQCRLTQTGCACMPQLHDCRLPGARGRGNAATAHGGAQMGPVAGPGPVRSGLPLSLFSLFLPFSLSFSFSFLFLFFFLFSLFSPFSLFPSFLSFPFSLTLPSACICMICSPICMTKSYKCTGSPKTATLSYFYCRVAESGN